MYLIIGLGNPEKQYWLTRHNAGFMAVDFLVEKLNLEKFKLQQKFKAEISISQYNNTKIIVAKPQTYMNNSGMAVQLLKNYFKIQTENLIVVYDELDLPFETIRVKHEGSSAGHNGIKSIIEYLGSNKFNRIRIGIHNNDTKKISADKFVLGKFSFWDRRKLVQKIFPMVIEEILKLLRNI